MILNLTQHQASAEQDVAGVQDLADEGGFRRELKELLTFGEIPSSKDVTRRAGEIAKLAACVFDREDDPLPRQGMVGGAPFLMGPLEAALRKEGIDPVYAFSRRESAEEIQKDGAIKKVAVFRHLGFVSAA